MKEIFSELREFMNKAECDWYVCGGYAIDLFAGHNTRSHRDLNVAVFWPDKARIVRFMLGEGWRVFESLGGGSIYEIVDEAVFTADNRNLVCIRNDNSSCRLSSIGSDIYKFSIHCKEQNRLDFIEFLFNQKADDNFCYAKNLAIRRSMQDAVLAEGGVPFLAPELILLYKSGYIEYLDKEDEFALHTVSIAVNDFNMLLSLMNNERKEWLKKALRTVYPNGHSWIRRIDRAASQ